MDDVEDTPPPLVIWEHQISADDGSKECVAFPPDAQQTIRTGFGNGESAVIINIDSIPFAITFDRSKFKRWNIEPIDPKQTQPQQEQIRRRETYTVAIISSDHP